MQIDSITTDGAVDDNTDQLRLSAVEQLRDGEWVKVGRRYGLTAQRGKMLKVRAVLKAADGTLSYAPFSTRIGPRARSGSLNVMGGASQWTNIWNAKSVAEVQEAYADSASNDQVLFNLRLRRNGGKINVMSEEQSSVVVGRKYYYVDLDGGRGGPACRGC